MILKNRLLSLTAIIFLMVSCLGVIPKAGLAETILLEETRIDLSGSSNNWFMVAPLSESWDIYGLSFLLEAGIPDPQGIIMVEVYRAAGANQAKQTLNLERIRIQKIYPKDLNEKRFYTIFFRGNKKGKAHVSDYKPFVGGANDRFIINIKTKNKIYIYLQQDTKSELDLKLNTAKSINIRLTFWGKLFSRQRVVKLGQIHQRAILHWVTVPMWGCFAGTVLSDAEKPYFFLTPLFYLFLFEWAIIFVLMRIFFGKNFLREQESWRIFSVVFFTSFIATCLYYATVSTDFLGGDNFDMQLCQFTYKDTHYPGYPIMLLFGYLFGVLMPVGNFMYKANLFATLCASMGIGFFAGAAYRIFNQRALAVMLALFLATTQTVWNYSVVAQNYSMLILFQCFLIFAVVHLQLRPNFSSFFKFCVFAFLAPIAHMTNAPGVLFILPVVIIRYWKVHRFNFYKFLRIFLTLLAIFVILYSPLFFRRHANNYPAVMVRDAEGKLRIDSKNVHIFFGYITGNSSVQSKATNGITDILKKNGVVNVLKSQLPKALFLLNYGYGYIFVILGVIGLVLLFIVKAKYLITWYLFFMIAGNMVLNCGELLFFHGLRPDDYVLTVHQIPTIICLSFSISGIILLVLKKEEVDLG